MGRSNDVAMPPGADPAVWSRHLAAVHDAFVASGQARPRSQAAGGRVVATQPGRGAWTPEAALAAIRLDDDALNDIREVHPLAPAMPVIRRLLVEDAADSGLLVAVSDAAGQLLWVEGSSWLRAKAEGMHFVPGADWTEGSARHQRSRHGLGTGSSGPDLRTGALGTTGHPVELFCSTHPRPRHRSTLGCFST